MISHLLIQVLGLNSKQALEREERHRVCQLLVSIPQILQYLLKYFDTIFSTFLSRFIGQSQATSDNAAAWTAYYAQYYAQYQAHAQAIPSVAYPGQAALTVPTATNIPQQQQQQIKSASSDTTQSGTGQTSQQADYSAQWVEYYKALGHYKEAEAIEQMMKQQQQTPTQHKQ